MKRKLCWVVAVLAMAALPVLGLEYPTKNISVIVPYGAGGTTDLSVRAMLDSIPDGTIPKGVSFVVTNMPGGSGLIGMNKYVTAKKDGYTLGLVNCDFLLNSVKGVTPLKLEQFVPLVFVQADPYLVLVKADAPYQTFQEFVDYMRKNPGAIKFGDSGSGTVPNFAIVAIQKALGVEVKTMSYDTSLESTLAVVRDEVQATVAHSGACIGQLEAKAVKALAVTSNERLSLFPDVPAIGELYQEAAEMRVLSWIAVAALEGTPPEMLDTLRDAFTKSVKSDAFKQKIKMFHMQEVNMFSSEAMNKFFDEQAAYYKKNLD